MGRDGSNSSQLLGDAASAILEPATCGDHTWYCTWVFHAGARVGNIWRANSDGPIQLNSPAWLRALQPVRPTRSGVLRQRRSRRDMARSRGRIRQSGGDSWFGFAQHHPGRSAPHPFARWKDCGPSCSLNALNPDVMKPEDEIELINVETPASPRMLRVEPGISGGGIAGGGFQFTPDGKSLAYAVRQNGVDNVWRNRSMVPPAQDYKLQLRADRRYPLVARRQKSRHPPHHSDSDVVLLQEARP